MSIEFDTADGEGVDIFMLPSDDLEDVKSAASSTEELLNLIAENSIPDLTFRDTASERVETELSEGDYVMVFSKVDEQVIVVGFAFILDGVSAS